MLRALKILVAAVLSAAAAAAGLSAAALLLLFYAPFTEQVVFPLVSRFSPITIEGTVLSSSPVGHLQVRDLRIIDDKKPLVSAESGRADFLGEALLKGDLQIAKLSLESPVFRVQSMAEQGSPQPSEAAGGAFDWIIQSLTVKNAELVLVRQGGSEGGQQTVKIAKGSGGATNLGPDSAAKINLSGSLVFDSPQLNVASDRGSVDVEIAFGRGMDVERIGGSASFPELAVEKKDLQFEGTDLSFTGALVPLDQGVRFNEVEVAQQERPGKISVSGFYPTDDEGRSSPPLAFTLTDVPASMLNPLLAESQQITGGKVSGEISLSSEPQNLTVRGNIEGSGIELQRLAEPFEFAADIDFVSNRGGDYSLRGNARGGTFVIESMAYDAAIELDLTYKNGMAECNDCYIHLIDQSVPNEETPDQSVELQIASAVVDTTPTDGRISFESKIETASYRAIEGNNLAVAGSIGNERIEVNNISGTLADADVNLQGWTTREPLGEEFHMRGTVEGLSLTELDKTLRAEPRNPVRGTVDILSFNFSGASLLSAPLNKDLRGRVEGKFTKVYLPRALEDVPPFNLVFLPFQVAGSTIRMLPTSVLPGLLKTTGAEIGEFFRSSQQLHIDKGTVKLRAEEGVVELSDVAFDTTILPHVNLGGKIYPDHELDMHSTLALLGVELSLPIGGTLAKPRPNIRQFAQHFTTRLGISVAKLPLTAVNTLRANMPCFLKGVGLATGCDEDGEDQDYYRELAAKELPATQDQAPGGTTSPSTPLVLEQSGWRDELASIQEPKSAEASEKSVSSSGEKK